VDGDVNVNFGDFANGVVGYYDPTKYRNVYAMGNSYKITSGGGSLGNLYGLFYAYDDTTSGYKNVTGDTCGHGFGVAGSGTPYHYFGASGAWINTKLKITGIATIGTGRPVSIDGTSGGNVTIQAGGGGWGMGLYFKGSSGTFRGGYGAYGSDNTVTYYWIGPDLGAEYIIINSTGMSIGANLAYSTPSYRMDVRGSIGTTAGITTADGVIGTINGATLVPNNAFTYTQWYMSGSKNGYYGFVVNTTNSPSFMFDGSGNGGIYHPGTGFWTLYYLVSNGCVGIGTSSTSSSYKAYIGGALYATGDIVAYSDRRAKENINTIDNPLAKVEQLRGVYYNKIKTPDKKEMGVIAQEILEILPEVVTYDTENDQYGVSYGNITAILIESIKELSHEVKRLKEKLGE
jgi:hypothetical protein